MGGQATTTQAEGSSVMGQGAGNGLLSTSVIGPNNNFAPRWGGRGHWGGRGPWGGGWPGRGPGAPWGGQGGAPQPWQPGMQPHPMHGQQAPPAPAWQAQWQAPQQAGGQWTSPQGWASPAGWQPPWMTGG